jgi:CheY-like chemotaxis protein
MNTWISGPQRESSIQHSPPFASETITALYLTVDLAEADYLVYEVHKIAPKLRLDISLRVLHAIDRLRSGRHHAVLVDLRVPRKDRSQLIAHIHKEKLPLPIILIFGRNEEDPAYQALKAGAHERIVKGPSFPEELPAVIEKALTRHQSGVTRQAPAPLHWEDPTPKPDPLKQEKAAGKAPEPPAHASTVPAHRQRSGAEKRISPRYEVYIPCSVQWQNHSYDACIHDLSTEGAFVETAAPAPADSLVGVLLKVAAAELQLEATVTHYGWYMTAVRNFDGIGIRFKNLSRQADDILRELRSRSVDPAPPKAPLER